MQYDVYGWASTTVVDSVVSVASKQCVSLIHLLVMVSSELVVLLIVCVGINTGSAQQGELVLYCTTIYTLSYKNDRLFNCHQKIFC